MTLALRHADLDAVAASVREHGAVAVVEDALAALADAPAGVLIGAPLAESARAEAVRLDATDSDGAAALRGVPFVVKDNIDVGSVATTAACPGFSYVADRDAGVVAAVRAAGAIVVGKANLDQFATGLVGTRSPYGTPPNALDARLVPGGSSSGSAVAVALGYVPFALGTDTAGSGRVPAALNGIVGFKPTVGRLDTSGMVPAIRRLDCPSVFARSVSDAALVASVLEPAGPVVSALPTRDRSDPLTVGIPMSWPAGTEPVASIELAFHEGLARLGAMGAVLRPVDIAPLLALGRMLYGSALVAERTLAVGPAVAAGVDGLDPVVTAVIGRGFEMTAVDAYRTEYELVDRRAAARAVLEHVDVLALPTTTFVPTLAEVERDPFGVNDRMGTLTTFVNLLDLPAVVVPIPGPTPMGLQLLGAPWQDAALLALAAAI
ncbi:MAG: amidase family protein [Ilumatobacteraceae bacterium]